VKTARLCLRRLRVEDAEDVHLIRSRPEVMVYSYGLRPVKSGNQGNRLNKLQLLRLRNNHSTHAELDTRLPQPSRLIGLIGAVEAPEIGYLIHPDFWGCGPATEALQAFMPLYWQHFRTEFDFATAQIDLDNGASKKVLLKCGFRLEDRKVKGFENPSLGLKDIEIHRLQRPEAVGQ
ncbi:GNAT domain-containing protein, partial [Phyllosticta paracitricarpa]